MRRSRLIQASLLAGLIALGSAPQRTSAQTLPVDLVLVPSERGAPSPGRPTAPLDAAATSGDLPTCRGRDRPDLPPSAAWPRLPQPNPRPEFPGQKCGPELAGHRTGRPVATAVPARCKPPAELACPAPAPNGPRDRSKAAAATHPPSAAPPAGRRSRPQSATAIADAEIVDRANAYFTDLNTLVADFTQVGGDGRRASAGRSISSVPARSASNTIHPPPSK